jgi:ZIP family zinc transporter
MAFAIGMMSYMLVGGVLHSVGRGGKDYRRHLGPVSLTLHSLFDGTGMGVAFHLSTSAGIAVALAVIAHDIADGINTIGLGLASGSRRWLLADSLAPLVGLLIGLGADLDSHILSLALATFAGALFYVGACEVLPSGRAEGSHLPARLSTAGGMVAVFLFAHVLQA